MDLKTENHYFNEDDFVETDGQMKELTVTITLCEYRNLIQERCYNEKAIDILQEENQKLRNTNETLTKYILATNPEIKGNINETIEAFAKVYDESEEKENA